MQRLKFKFQNFLLITVYGLLISSFFGCATPEKKVSPLTYPEEKPAGKEGVYHRVKRGETLWRIAKLYDVELEKIAQANHLSDTTKIFQGQMIFIPDARHSLSRKDFSGKEFIWPLKGKIVSSFGTKRADGTVNRGIDILPQETYQIVAIKKGKVIFSSEKVKGLGKTLIVEHAEQIYSVYGNISSILVKCGQEVQQGELIAEAKNGAVHFEIRKGHIPQNPLYFLP